MYPSHLIPFPTHPNAPGGPKRSSYLRANHTRGLRLGTQARTALRYSTYSLPKLSVSVGSSYPCTKVATIAQKTA